MQDTHASQAVAHRPAVRRWPLRVLKGLVLYCIVSMATLPFVNWLWLGELPVIAVLQLPKLLLAEWLRTDVVMPAIKGLGLSSGAFSPDYTMARPYALVVAYLLPIVVVLVTAALRSRMASPYRLWSCLLLCAAALDCLLTLKLASSPGLSLY